MDKLTNETFKESSALTTLKVCGITNAEDANQLVKLAVSALGFNFWSKSKRYIQPERAAEFSQGLKGSILRIGVFVNAEHEEILNLLEDDVIDIAQLHGDEDANYCQQLAKSKHPFIKAIGVANKDSLKNLSDYNASAILLDAHAPVTYGGTGDTFDWDLAKQVIEDYPEIPVILAGGITPENTSLAINKVRPCMLDVASGAEISPGIKDFNKIAAIQHAIKITQE